MPSKNATKGHNYERDVIRILQNIGFPHAVSTRSESRSLDAQKVDITNKNAHKNGRLPFNFQCKSLTDVEIESGKAERVKYRELLHEIELTEGIFNVVLHRHTVKKGTKFMVQGEYAFMHQLDFFKLVEEKEKYKEAYEEIDNRLKTLGL
jgi:Holliday junction resolvase